MIQEWQNLKVLKLGAEYIGVHCTILFTLYRFEIFHNKKFCFFFKLDAHHTTELSSYLSP